MKNGKKASTKAVSIAITIASSIFSPRVTTLGM